MKENSIKLTFDIHFFLIQYIFRKCRKKFHEKMELQWNWKYRRKEKIFEKKMKKKSNLKKGRNHRYHDEEGRHIFDYMLAPQFYVNNNCCGQLLDRLRTLP